MDDKRIGSTPHTPKEHIPAALAHNRDGTTHATKQGTTISSHATTYQQLESAYAKAHTLKKDHKVHKEKRSDPRVKHIFTATLHAPTNKKSHH